MGRAAVGVAVVEHRRCGRRQVAAGREAEDADAIGIDAPLAARRAPCGWLAGRPAAARAAGSCRRRSDSAARCRRCRAPASTGRPRAPRGPWPDRSSRRRGRSRPPRRTLVRLRQERRDRRRTRHAFHPLDRTGKRGFVPRVRRMVGWPKQNLLRRLRGAGTAIA